MLLYFGIIRNCPQGFYNAINSAIKCFQDSYFRQHPVLKCPLEINWICFYWALVSFCILIWVEFTRRRVWMFLLFESLYVTYVSLFLFFFAPRINISRWGGSCAAHRRVLCSFDWTQLWWTVQASLRCVYHRSKCCKAVVKGLICLKMSHFVKFVSILRVSYSFNSCRGWLCGTWTAPENCQSK